MVLGCAIIYPYGKETGRDYPGTGIVKRGHAQNLPRVQGDKCDDCAGKRW